MLWRSIAIGLHMFAYWQTYAVACGMTVLIVLPKLYMSLLLDKNMYGETPLTAQIVWYLIRHHAMDDFKKLRDRAFRAEFSGGFKGLILVAFFEFLGSYFGIFTLLPLVVASSDRVNWLLPWMLPLTMPWLFLKMVGALAVAVVLVSKVPILGEVVMYPISVAVALYMFGTTPQLIIPSFWMSGEILAAGLAIKWGFVLAIAFGTAWIPSNVRFSLPYRLVKVAVFFLMPMWNLLPAFIYGGWLASTMGRS